MHSHSEVRLVSVRGKRLSKRLNRCLLLIITTAGSSNVFAMATGSERSRFRPLRGSRISCSVTDGSSEAIRHQVFRSVLPPRASQP